MVKAIEVSNWNLYYRSNANGTCDFAELIRHELRLLRYEGKSQTWGKRIAETFETEAELQSAFHFHHKCLVDSGHVVTREWIIGPHRFDFDLFRQEVETAAASTFRKLREQYTGVNAFAVGRDHDAMTIVTMASCFSSLTNANDDILWCPDEWDIQDCDQSFDIPYHYCPAISRTGFVG